MGIPALTRLRAWKRRPLVGLAAALVAGGGALAGTPLHAAAATTVTLSATGPTTVNAGTYASLRATVSEPPGSDYSIFIEEVGTGASAGSCDNSASCDGQATYPAAGSHTFHAFLYNPPNTTLTSNTVTLTWVGSASYTLTLSASKSQALGGEHVTLQAMPSPNVPTGYRVDIWETGGSGTPRAVGAGCGNFGCYTDVSHNSGQYSYVAYLDNDGVQEYPPTPGSVIASAGPITVTWTPASEVYCSQPTLSIIDGQVGPLDVLLSLTSGAAQTAVCFHVRSLPGVAVGGALLVNVTVSPSAPAVVDGNMCLGAQGNAAPGPHPIIDEAVAGQRVYLDDYSGPSSDGETWVCASVGGVAKTVVLPVGLNGQPSLTFVPDGDSLVKG